jgi:hypothetical protein
VRRWLQRLGAWVLLGLAGAGFSAELQLEFDRQSVEWGKPLRGFVVYRGTTDHGHVVSGYAEVGGDETGEMTRRQSVRLYPRRMGEQMLPALSYAGVRSEPLRIDVRPPRPQHGSLTLDHQVSAERVTAGEQLAVQVRLVTTDPRVRVSIDPIEQAGVSTAMLGSSVEPGPDDSVVHRLGWSLHFAEAGRHRLALPPVRYTLFGRDLYQIHLPLLEVEVEALPGYVPLTVPVGRLTVESRIEPWQGVPAWWVRVETDGRLPIGLPELEGQLARLAAVQPARIAREQHEEARPDGRYSVIAYRAPLPRWSSGLGPGPQITLQVYDPQRRRVQRQRHILPGAWRAPGWFVVALGVLPLVLALPLGRRLRHAGRRWQGRHRLLGALRRAPDADTLRRRLLEHTGCRTLGEVASRWDLEDHGVVTRLNAACFGPTQTGDLQALRRDLFRSIRRGR